MKILNFGSLNIDRVYSVDHLVRPGETLTSNGFKEFAGGKGLNQSIALTRAGAEVYHAGKIGSDGLFLKRLLSENGVDVSLVQMSETPTGHAIIQVNRAGENSIILFGGANKEISRAEIRAALAGFNTGDWLLLQNEVNGIADILSLASERSLKVMFNPAPMTQDVQNLPIEVVDWLVVNEVEGEAITGQSAPEETIDAILTKYPGISLILTLGGRGVHFAKGAHRLFTPAEQVTPVDTTGAGDTFVGYFLAELTKGLDIENCLRLASKAAAVCVTRKGAAASIPTRAELF